MDQIMSAALRLGLVTLAFIAIAAAVWWFRRPRTASAAPREGRLPKLPRKAPDQQQVEIAPSRLARISGKTPSGSVAEPEDRPAPVPAPAAAPAVPSDRALRDAHRAIEATLEAMAAETEQRAFAAAPAAEAVSLRLVPQIPPRDAISTNSWLGGRPRLSPGMAWPKIGEQPADFLAQIACADLPRALWGGLGPRDGALAFFIDRSSPDVRVLHLRDAGPPVAPPLALNTDGWFGPYGGIAAGDLASFAVRAFPEWPVDLVAVGPGTPDPRDEGNPHDLSAALYGRGYDIADPAFHPFDWGSMTAMITLLAMRLDRLMIDDAPPADIDDEGLGEWRRCAAINREARERAQEIIAIVHDSAARDAFSPGDATAVMAALHAIRWARPVRDIDPGTGLATVGAIILPLTTHRADATLWVHDYQAVLFDRAKHAWCANPDHLPALARAFYEPFWRDLAAREIAAMGHAPFHPGEGDAPGDDAVLIELPTSGLMSRRFGEDGSLVVTIARADLAIGDFSNVRARIDG